MSFIDALRDNIGKTIEVFLENNFYTGVLIRVDEGIFVVRTDNQTYYSPPVDVTILISSVVYVRILT